MRRCTFRTLTQILIVTVVVLIFVVLLQHGKGEGDEIFFNPSFLNGQHMLLPAKLEGKQLPFHQIYEPRQVSLEGYKETVHYQPRKDKVILLWTPWNHQWKTINYYSLQNGRVSFTKYRCPNANCTVTTDRKKIQKVDTVLFHLLDTKMDDLPSYRRPDQIWILYNLEAPWLTTVDFKKMNGVFNWTMSYREDSDVVVKYGMFAKRNVSFSEDDVKLVDRKPVVWLSSDCKTDSRREEYVKELSRHIEVDVYGTCGKKKCFPAQSDYCYSKILGGYYFYLSFENSICRDYVTEKFFNVLNYDIVPIVMGGAKYDNLAPKDSFIDVRRYPNPRDLAALLKALIKNETLYKTYFIWKRRYASYLYPWTCYLCDKIHMNTDTKVQHDLQQWWLQDAHCHRWELGKGFVPL